MSKGIICDRCGKVQPEEGSSVIKRPVTFTCLLGKGLQYVLGYKQFEYVDLCKECSEDFERWMKGDEDAD